MWFRILKSLRIRGKGVRESGAFLLSDPDRGKIADYILYDDIDPTALDKGHVHFDSALLGEVWEYCSEHDLKVIADVHTHPKGAGVKQSITDRMHPAIPQEGHIAMIVPNYSENWFISLDEIGIYKYLGNKQWETITNGNAIKLSIL